MESPLLQGLHLGPAFRAAGEMLLDRTYLLRVQRLRQVTGEVHVIRLHEADRSVPAALRVRSSRSARRA